MTDKNKSYSEKNKTERDMSRTLENAVGIWMEVFKYFIRAHDGIDQKDGPVSQGDRDLSQSNYYMGLAKFSELVLTLPALIFNGTSLVIERLDKQNSRNRSLPPVFSNLKMILK